MSHPSPLGRITTRVRRLTARHPRLRWLPVITAAIAVLLSSAAHHRRVDAERRAWGETVPVWVATSDIAPGDSITVERRQIPVALTPDDVIIAEAAPPDAVARQRLGAGRIVTGVDLAAGSGSDALIPVGWRGVPVDEVTASGAAVGDRVDVVSDGMVLAAAALVTGRDGGVVTVAVPADAAPLVALANQSGVALLRLPAGAG